MQGGLDRNLTKRIYSTSRRFYDSLSSEGCRLYFLPVEMTQDRFKFLTVLVKGKGFSTFVPRDGSSWNACVVEHFLQRDSKVLLRKREW